MDHQSAHVMEFTADPIETKTIASKFTHEAKELSLHKGEIRMHNKEQHQQSEFYKTLGNTIRHYESVILFGPTEAKVELYNLLKADHQFSKINIEVQESDKMTENQQHAFVKEYFTKHPSPAGHNFFYKSE